MPAPFKEHGTIQPVSANGISTGIGGKQMAQCPNLAALEKI